MPDAALPDRQTPESFLHQDPRNSALLTEAFEVALSAAGLDHAEYHLRYEPFGCAILGLLQGPAGPARANLSP